MGNKIKIDGRSIGAEYPPYIIAEMSANHNGSIENAFKIIKAAKQSGADAVKLQTYRPDTITLDCDSEDFQIHGGLWDGRTLYDLYEEAHMPWEWHASVICVRARTGHHHLQLTVRQYGSRSTGGSECSRPIKSPPSKRLTYRSSNTSLAPASP